MAYSALTRMKISCAYLSPTERGEEAQRELTVDSGAADAIPAELVEKLR